MNPHAWLDQKYLKKFLSVLERVEIQTTTNLRFHLNPVRMAKIKKQMIKDVGAKVKKKQTSFTVGRIENLHSPSEN